MEKAQLFNQFLEDGAGGDLNFKESRAEHAVSTQWAGNRFNILFRCRGLVYMYQEHILGFFENVIKPRNDLHYAIRNALSSPTTMPIFQAQGIFRQIPDPSWLKLQGLVTPSWRLVVQCFQEFWITWKQRRTESYHLHITGSVRQYYIYTSNSCDKGSLDVDLNRDSAIYTLNESGNLLKYHKAINDAHFKLVKEDLRRSSQIIKILACSRTGNAFMRWLGIKHTLMGISTRRWCQEQGRLTEEAVSDKST